MLSFFSTTQIRCVCMGLAETFYNYMMIPLCHSPPANTEMRYKCDICAVSIVYRPSQSLKDPDSRKGDEECIKHLLALQLITGEDRYLCISCYLALGIRWWFTPSALSQLHIRREIYRKLISGLSSLLQVWVILWIRLVVSFIFLSEAFPSQ